MISQPELDTINLISFAIVIRSGRENPIQEQKCTCYSGNFTKWSLSKESVNTLNCFFLELLFHPYNKTGYYQKYLHYIVQFFSPKSARRNTISLTKVGKVHSVGVRRKFRRNYAGANDWAEELTRRSHKTVRHSSAATFSPLTDPALECRWLSFPCKHEGSPHLAGRPQGWMLRSRNGIQTLVCLYRSRSENRVSKQRL